MSVPKKVTIVDLKAKKERGEKITMLTAYDHFMGGMIDAMGIDSVLVGDSLGNVVLGYDSTIPVTMDEMLHHCGAVRRAVKRAFLIGDMPFMSYQISDERAVANAGRFVKEAGCQAVKIEGGAEIVSRIRAIDSAGIPVIGHIGLTPQHVNKMGGYRVQGKGGEEAAKIIDDASRLEEAGCSMVILECVPAPLAGEVTASLGIPVIGIGAGAGCDGQVLVTNDMIGCSGGFTPRFVKKYADLSVVIREAIESFRKETEEGIFPGEEHSF